jgi:hypothetical protein
LALLSRAVEQELPRTGWLVDLNGRYSLMFASCAAYKAQGRCRLGNDATRESRERQVFLANEEVRRSCRQPSRSVADRTGAGFPRCWAWRHSVLLRSSCER